MAFKNVQIKTQDICSKLVQLQIIQNCLLGNHPAKNIPIDNKTLS